MTIILFDELKLNISEENWQFLLQHRFSSKIPTNDELQAEFVSGTGITKKRKDLWPKAEIRFNEYIDDLKDIQSLDVNSSIRDLIDNNGDSICI